MGKFVRIAVACFVAGVLVACARNGSAVSGHIVQTQTDPNTGALMSVKVNVTNDTDQDLPLEFVVRSGNSATYWSSATFNGRLDAKATRDLVLTPQTSALQPHLGEEIAVYAVHKETGEESAIGSKMLAGAAERIVNPTLSAWHPDQSSPIGWQPSGPSGDERISFTPANISNRQGVRIAVRASKTNVWHVAFIQQPVKMKSTRIIFNFVPTADCDGASPQPRMLSGAQFIDEIGNSVLFCVSPRVRAREAHEINGGRQLVVVSPGKIGQWNQVAADPQAYTAFVHLRPDKGGAIELRLAVQMNLDPDARNRRNDTSVVFGPIVQLK